MLHTFWSVKGGSGVTVVSAAVAASIARRHGAAILVDLRGDQPAALGLAEATGPGVRDWLATADGSADALARLLVGSGDGLAVIPAGRAVSWGPDRVADLIEALRRLDRPVVVDAGVVEASGSADPINSTGAELARSGRSTLVIRPCYLAMRRAVARGATADDVVLVVEPGRALDRRDVAQVLGLPVVASVEVDPAVARSVDAGLLLRRTHRPLERALRSLS